MVMAVAAVCAVPFLAGCAATTSRAGEASAVRPGRTIAQTLQRAIGLLESSRCEVFALEFLSPIKRAQIKDLDAYREGRKCPPDDRGNLDDVLLALRLALGAEPSISGVKATIDLSGIGISVTKLELVKYTDGRWYFNEL